MNCTEFRERCLAEPDCTDEEFLAHKRQCPQCAAEAERLSELEIRIREAAEIDVPDGLADRILARHAIAQGAVPDQVSGRRTRPPWRQWYALAASLLLVIGIVAGGFYVHQRTMPLSEAVAVAVKDDMPRYDKMVADNQVDPNIERNLHAMLRAVGVKMVGDLGPIYYCQTTTIDDRMTGIFVLRGKMGAVMVVYVKGDRVRRRGHIRNAHMQGVMWPEKAGSVAIIGHPGEPMLGDIERRVQRTMQWF